MQRKDYNSRNVVSPAAKPNARRARRSAFDYREYERKLAILALSRVPLVLAPDQNSGFYHPEVRPNPVPLPAKPESNQLAMDFMTNPLYDLWHEPEEIK